ncbi:MAG: lysophospholipid acyltransferase family protein [Gammaproteobacteria bacterium]|jgi:KDO2-lipid IV(A) lauroyltransferase
MRAAIAKLLIRVMSLLPLGLAQRIGAAIGYTAYLIPNNLHRPLHTNIDLCFPSMPADQRARLYRDSFMELGRAMAETGALWLWGQDRLLRHVKQVSGEGALEQGFAKGKGVILALPHLGAWELMGVYCSRKYPMTSLFRPLRLKELNPFIKQARERIGATLVPTNASGIRALYRALSSNELVAILPDQEPDSEGSVFAPFCGVAASTMTLLPKLAQRSGAAIVYGYAERLSGGGYHIHFLAEQTPLPADDLVQSTTLINQGVEKCMRQAPAQYQWTYKRFKTRPEGEQRFY